MLRSPFVLLLALCLTTALGAKEKTPPAPTLPDAEVVALLSPVDVIAWERAMEIKEQGESLIDTGTRLSNRTPSLLRDADDTKRDQEDGKRMLRAGEERLAEANAILDTLRAKAMQAKPDEVINGEPVVYNLEVQPRSYTTSMPDLVEGMLFELWGAGYKRIYLLGAWATTGDDIVALPDARDYLLAQLRKKDGNRYTVVPDQDIEFVYTVVREKPAIEFPNKGKVIEDFPTALVYVEYIPSEDGTETTISMRAVDASDLRLVKSKPLLSPADTQLELLLGEKMGGQDAEAGPVSISMTLQDNERFIERVAPVEHEYVFGYRYQGDDTSYRSRRANALLKAMLLPTGVTISDEDFLSQALAPDDTMETTYNAVWQLTPQEPGMPPHQTYQLQAISLRDEEKEPVIIGTLETVSAGASNESG